MKKAMAAWVVRGLWMVLWMASRAAGAEASPAAQEAVPDFLAACAAAAGSGEGMTVTGRDGWLFLRSELRHLGAGPFWGEAAQTASTATREDWRDPLAAILDYRKRLDEAGVGLLLVPVPPKAVVYADKVQAAGAPAPGAPVPRLDVHHQAFYALLRERGVDVLDLVPAMAARRDAGGEPVYCRTDTHWSGVGCRLAAEAIARHVKAAAWYADAPRGEFESEERSIRIDGDLLVGLDAADRPDGEDLTMRFVRPSGTGDAGLVESDAHSPVILLADSHGLVFHAGADMFCRGAGLADQLALELGFAVDLIAVRGSGATPARINLYRKSSADPAYLARKKLVVWCFAAREFTETTGWRPELPVRKQQ